MRYPSPRIFLCLLGRQEASRCGPKYCLAGSMKRRNVFPSDIIAREKQGDDSRRRKCVRCKSSGTSLRMLAVHGLRKTSEWDGQLPGYASVECFVLEALPGIVVASPGGGGKRAQRSIRRIFCRMGFVYVDGEKTCRPGFAVLP